MFDIKVSISQTSFQLISGTRSDFKMEQVDARQHEHINTLTHFSVAFSEKLAERIRERLKETPKVKEQRMMGGLTFMVNDKMCVGVFKDDLMCRIDPDLREDLLERTGCHTMAFSGKPMKGIVLVDGSGMHSKKDFEFWISQCLDFNKKAKRSKKKKA